MHIFNRPRPCAHCGTTIYPKRSDHLYCGTRCRVAVTRKRQREAETEKVETTEAGRQ